MRSYFWGLTSNYLSLFLGMIIILFLVPFLLNQVGAELTGVYFVLLTTANFVAIGIGWLAGAGVRLIGKASVTDQKVSPQEVHWVVVLGFAFYATLVLVFLIMVGLGAGKLWLVGGSERSIAQGRNACIALGSYIWINYIHNADLAMFTAALRQGQANLYRILAQGVFALLALLVMVWKPRIDYLILAQVAGALVAAVAARLHLRLTGLLKAQEWKIPRREIAREMFITVGGPYFLFGLAQFILLYSDVYLISAVLGAEAVASFIVVWKMAEFGGLVLSRISEILSPYLTRMEASGDFKSLKAVFLSTSRLQHWLGLTAGFGYALFGPYIVDLWVGEGIRPSEWWLFYCAGGVLFFQCVNRHDVILHFATGRVGALIGVHYIEVILKIALSLILFSYLGIGAPLVSFILVQVLGATWWYRKAGLRIVSSSLTEWWREVFRPAGTVFLFLIFFLNFVVPGNDHWTWVQVFSFGTALLGLVGIIMYGFERSRGITPLSSLQTLLLKG